MTKSLIQDPLEWENFRPSRLFRKFLVGAPPIPQVQQKIGTLQPVFADCFPISMTMRQ